MRASRRFAVTAASVAVLVSGAAHADDTPMPARADVEEHLGRRVPRGLTFRDSRGRPASLDALLARRKPLVLVLAYYRCPMLCGLVLHGIAKSMRAVPWQPGRQYQPLTVSFDPQDGPAEASRWQTTALRTLGRPEAPDEWPFWVGRPQEIRKLTSSVGFRYAYDPQTRQFAHPAVVIVLTPDGRVSRYFYGFDPPALDLRLSLLEASKGRIGSLGERVLMTCFRFEPTKRRYGVYVAGLFRLGGFAIVLAVAALLAVLFARERWLKRRTARGSA